MQASSHPTFLPSYLPTFLHSYNPLCDAGLSAQNPHPLPVTVHLLTEAIKRLRKIEGELLLPPTVNFRPPTFLPSYLPTFLPSYLPTLNRYANDPYAPSMAATALAFTACGVLMTPALRDRLRVLLFSDAVAPPSWKPGSLDPMPA